MPAPLVSSATSALFGKKAGSPTTSSAPSTAPVMEASPPMTATAITSNDAVASKRSVVNCWTSPTSSPPARPASAPDTANAKSFTRVGERPMADAASSLSRTASIDAAKTTSPHARNCDDRKRERAEAHPVVACVQVRARTSRSLGAA